MITPNQWEARRPAQERAIWVDFMKNAVANLATEQFSQPPG